MIIVIINGLSIGYAYMGDTGSASNPGEQTTTPSAQNEVCLTRGTGVGHPPRAPPSEGRDADRAGSSLDSTRRAVPRMDT